MFTYLRKCLCSHYATFKGRASRKEFWSMFLLQLVVAFLLSGTTHVFQGISFTATLIYNCIGVLISLALFIPYLAVFVRRVHDLSLSGWWVLIIYLTAIIGVVGGAIAFLLLQELPLWEIVVIFSVSIASSLTNIILTLYALCAKGSATTNNYGPSPLPATTEA